MQRFARTLLLGPLVGLALAVLGGTTPAPGPSGVLEGAPPAERTVYLAGKLSDEELLSLSAAVAGRKDAVLLLHAPGLATQVRTFVEAYRPTRVVPVGEFPAEQAELERQLGAPVASVVPDSRGLFPRAEHIVVCPAEPRGRLLQAACLAGIEGAPLWIVHSDKAEKDRLRAQCRRWGTRCATLIGEAGALSTWLPGVRVVRLSSESAVATAYQRRLSVCEPIHTAVLCNPADGAAGLATLAPWVAVQKRAALLLTGKDGRDADNVVERAVRLPALRKIEALVLVGDLRAIPVVKRPNPIAGDRDPFIEMEPLTPKGDRPFSFAVGRLFHKDRAVLPLLLARQRLLAEAPGPRRALVASNPGGELPLLETFSRNTARELRNAGYQTTALFGHDVNGVRLRKLLPDADVFLWEGHHNTLIKDWGFPNWSEPLPPSLVFLQSCLALREDKVGPLHTRGAVAVIGSSTRTYSGSGGALSLAFFNALLYDGQSVGASLRQAKNFLIAYTILKKKRLGEGATRTGANVRAAWAFTLWGDPTLQLPRPATSPTARPGVTHRVVGNQIVVKLPEETHDTVTTKKYQSSMSPNGRLGGLVRKEGGEKGQALVPLVFVEVSLPRNHPGQSPRLHTRLPDTHWAFLWDERRRCGYLLATPRPRDGRELRFRVEWPAAEVVSSKEGG